MKKMSKILLGLAALIMAVVPLAATAADFIAPTGTDNGTVVIGSGETHKNLYVAGSNVFINSQIQGDLFAGGGSVIVDGSVEQDAMLAGGTITINGRIGGDVRLAGGTITINSEVNGDVLIGGGQVHISEKANIRGDVVIGGGDVFINAPVAGSIRLGGGVATINNTVGGTVTVKAHDKVTFGEKAVVTGKVTVKAPQAPEIKPGAQVSTPEFTQIQKREHKSGFAKIFTIWFLIKAVAYMLAGFLVLYFLPKSMGRILQSMHSKMAPNMGIGLLVAIVTPILGIILLFTVIAFYIGIITFLWYALMLLFGCLFAGLFVGSWLIKVLTKRPTLTLDWQAVVIGSVVYVLLGAIPVLGWIIQVLLMLTAIGAMLRFKKEYIGKVESEQ